MRWVREIQKIGLRNWIWFVVYLRRDEFSRKLDLNRYYPDTKRLVRDRNKAHRLDMMLEEHNTAKVSRGAEAPEESAAGSTSARPTC